MVNMAVSLFTNLVMRFAATPLPPDSCDPSKTFFGLPVWYEYLNVTPSAGKTCDFNNFNFPGDLGLIALAVIDILLRISAFVAVGYIIYAGFVYATSQGSSDRTKKAQDSITNAIVGLVVAIIASVLVSFIGNSLK